MSQRSDKALDLFKEGQFCSQVVLSAFCDDVDITPEMALKMASSFGGGMGRMGEVCGAVTGAFMALGLLTWEAPTATAEEKNKINDRVRDFTARFKEQYGSIVCRDLLGCDLGQPEGSQQSMDKGGLCLGLPTRGARRCPHAGGYAQ